jgi:uncharacterized protein (TIGR02453 family)
VSAFQGFFKETFAFMEGLREHNNKEWFAEHRSDYESFYLEPAKAFVEDVGRPLKKIAPEARAEPRVGGSIFRINRDIRFSSDKRPYKDHLDFWFWEGDRKLAASGFFVRLQPERVSVGVGAHHFDKPSLERFRSAIGTAGDKLITAVDSIERAGDAVYGEHYKRPPRGYDASPETQRFLLFDSLWAVHEDEPSDVVFSEAFVGYCAGHWKKLAPLHRWLIEHVQTRA